MDRRKFLAGAGASIGLASSAGAWAAAASEDVSVNVGRDVVGALPHIWEECIGSDRAAITLRESWRDDIALARRELGIKRVRFHGIFNDELGVEARSLVNASGSINFRNVAEVYDGLISRGLEPAVELGFMPGMLASADRTFGFYKGNISPPKSSEDWGALIAEFARFLAGRYGIANVVRWPFEVWNEPNLQGVFWTGTQADYFQLYKAAAVALKGVDPRIRVGGPATSSTQWVPEFLSFCATENAPVDFVSSHIYAGDKQERLFGPDTRYSINDVIPQAVKLARSRVRASQFPKLPLFMNEWSSDSPAMIAHVLAGVLGETEMMSHWVLSGTYEELGPLDYWLTSGMSSWPILMHGVPLPSYNTYRLMHALGHERLHAEGPALASRRPDGSLAVLVWNLAEVSQPAGLPNARAVRKVVGTEKRVTILLPACAPGQKVSVRFVD
ncbi:MAG: hypothetical protein KGP14_15220, partial [Betaproteobacteria bacterium]|nr:hypothetical protein [Betaproteobacteria bacterium]